MQGVESVSTLMDGELDADDAAREIARFKQDAARRDAWGTYHAIGDALRGDHAGTNLSSDFSKRFSERLAQEPTVLAPRVRAPRTLQTWALSAAASVAAVAAVGWVSMSMLNPDGTTGTIAKLPAATQAPATVATLAPDAPQAPGATIATAPVAPLQPAGPALVEPLATAPEHVQEYLLAHQGVSPSTAMQGVTPYIRTVSSVGNEPGLR